MNDDRIKFEGKKLQQIPRHSEEDLSKFVDAYLSGEVFTHKELGSLENIGRVFMPIMAGAATLIEDVVEDIGCIYEYMEHAEPRSAHGMPIFTSFRIMHKDDWAAVVAILKEEGSRRQPLKLVCLNKEAN